MPDDTKMRSSISKFITDISAIISVVTACFTVYLTVHQPEELLVSFDTSDESSILFGRFPLKTFLFNRGKVTELITSIDIIVLYSKQDRFPETAVENSAPLRACDEPSLSSAISAHGFVRNQPFRDLKTDSVRIVSSKIKPSAPSVDDGTPAFTADSEKVSSVNTTFSWNSEQFAGYNAVAVCPIISFHDRVGKRHQVSCRGWQSITILPHPDVKPTDMNFYGGILSWPVASSMVYKLLPATYSNDEMMPGSELCHPVDPFPDQTEIETEIRAETSIGIPP